MAMNKVMLRDTLYNCSHDCTQHSQEHKDYAKGVFVGVVGAIMAMADCDLSTAMGVVIKYLPRDFDLYCVPESWVEVYYA